MSLILCIHLLMAMAGWGECGIVFCLDNGKNYLNLALEQNLIEHAQYLINQLVLTIPDDAKAETTVEECLMHNTISIPEVNTLFISLDRANKLMHKSPVVGLDEQITINGLKYNLAGIMCRIGDTGSFGHYVSIVQQDGRWYLINDSFVEDFDSLEDLNSYVESDAFGFRGVPITKLAYTFRYERINEPTERAE